MSRTRSVYLALALALVVGAVAQASLVQKMDLGEVCARADKIFRGTVVSATEGTVEAGGGQLPTVTYLIKVEEGFQGEFITKGGEQYAEVTMLGNFKTRGIELPELRVGGNYLLMTSRPSAIGLSAPIGLGQGCFTISGKGQDLTATDGFGNSIKYSEIAGRIRAALEQ